MPSQTRKIPGKLSVQIGIGRSVFNAFSSRVYYRCEGWNLSGMPLGLSPRSSVLYAASAIRSRGIA